MRTSKIYICCSSDVSTQAYARDGFDSRVCQISRLASLARDDRGLARDNRGDSLEMTGSGRSR